MFRITTEIIIVQYFIPSPHMNICILKVGALPLPLSLSLSLCLSPMKMLLFPLSLTGGKARRLMRNREGEKYADGAYMVWYVCQLLLHILKCAPPLRRHTHLRCPVFLTISPSKKIVENHTYYSIDNINIH